MPQKNPKRQILKDFELLEISGVDRPAQPTALVSIIKRDDTNETTKMISEFIQKSIYSDDSAKTFSQALVEETFRENVWSLSDALRMSIRSIVDDSNVDMEQKKIMIGESATAYANKLISLLGEDAVTKLAAEIIKSSQETETMPDDTVKKLQEQLENMAAENKRVAAIAKMNDAEKVYFEKASDKDKEEFLDMPPEKRKEKMKKAAESEDDEVLVIGDQTVSKSVIGPQAFAGLKAQQLIINKQAEDIRKAKEEAEMAVLKKRADDEYSHLTGSTEERASILKAMNSMDEQSQKALNAILKSAEEMASKAYDSLGHKNSPAESFGDATNKLDELTKKHAELHKCDYYTAYNEVIVKHADLYDQSLNEAS